ncbi:hypothetical protein BZG36_04320 [Bifiguratus adelaidae]|uniref:Uncharacterized protein n=1 Tax=Bifiguratus adelaidae TaxID=1938954 RepID=A0A261XVB7_9FUNG|nr:hypothetical protein BZG36_04320 [Bifiguratus adelaidae]
MVRAEVRFLGKASMQAYRVRMIEKGQISRDPSFNPASSSSSNIAYMDALFVTLSCTSHPKGVLCKFRYMDKDERRSLRVDLVADDGRTWINVISRNPKGLRAMINGFERMKTGAWHNWMDEVPLLRQARGFKQAAEQNLVHYVEPEIVFVFSAIAEGDNEVVDRVLFGALKAIGVQVRFLRQLQQADKSDRPDLVTQQLNLDVTTLIALVTALSYTHGLTPDDFDVEPLRLQALDEQKEPLLEQLARLFVRRSLFTPITAAQKFLSIVHTVGGPQERTRALSLFPSLPNEWQASLPSKEAIQLAWQHWPIHLSPRPSVTIVPDHPSRDILSLVNQPYSSLTPYQAIIIGTGHHYKRTTTTATTQIGFGTLQDGRMSYATDASYEFLSELVYKRIATINYLRRAHEGNTHWFNTVLINREDLHKAYRNTPMRKRTVYFYTLGVSLGPILDITTASDYVKALNILFTEFEYHTNDHAKPKMKNIFRKMYKEDHTIDSGDYTYLQVPIIPFELDYLQTFFTLTDILVETYHKLLLGTQDVCNQAFCESVVKIDGKIKRIITLVTKELDSIARKSIKEQLELIDPLSNLKGLVSIFEEWDS